MMFMSLDDGTDDTSWARACATAARCFSLVWPPYSSFVSVWILHIRLQLTADIVSMGHVAQDAAA